MRKFLILIALGWSLSACSTMNKNECNTSDWRAIVYEDGVEVRSGSYLSKHRKACAKHEVTPQAETYYQGHARGVRIYCRPQNAFLVGRRGSTYQGVCPEEMAADFEFEYSRGYAIYTMERRFSQLGENIRGEQLAIDHARTRINEIEYLLVQGVEGKSQRTTLVLEMRDLKKQIDERIFAIDQMGLEMHALEMQIEEALNGN